MSGTHYCGTVSGLLLPHIVGNEPVASDGCVSGACEIQPWLDPHSSIAGGVCTLLHHNLR